MITLTDTPCCAQALNTIRAENKQKDGPKPEWLFVVCNGDSSV